MSRTNLQTLFQTSLESHTELPEALGTYESMESDLIDILASFEEAEEHSDAVDELEDIEDALEAIALDLEESMENGGIDAQAAKMLHHAVGAHLNRLGLEETGVPSVESFGGDSGQLSSTQISMESIAENLKKIWAAIRAAIEKAIKAVTDFFAKVFGGADKVIARIKAAKTKVKDIKGTPPAKFKVPSPNSLQLNGKVDVASIKTGLKNFENALSTYETILKEADNYYSVVSSGITKIRDKDEESAAEERLAEAKKSEERIFSVTMKSRGHKVSGDKALVTSSAVDSLEKPTAKIVFTRPADAKNVQNAEIPGPSALDLLEILSFSETLIQKVKGSKNVLETVKKSRQDAIKAGDEVIKASDRGRVGKVWTKGKSRVLLRRAQADYVRPYTQMVSHAFSVARSAVAMAESASSKFKES